MDYILWVREADIQSILVHEAWDSNPVLEVPYQFLGSVDNMVDSSSLADAMRHDPSVLHVGDDMGDKAHAFPVEIVSVLDFLTILDLYADVG